MDNLNVHHFATLPNSEIPLQTRVGEQANVDVEAQVENPKGLCVHLPPTVVPSIS